MDIAELFARTSRAVHGSRRSAWIEGLQIAGRSPRTQEVADACWSDAGLGENELRLLADPHGAWEVLLGIDRAIGRMVRSTDRLFPPRIGGLVARLQDTGLLTEANCDDGVVLTKGEWCRDLPPMDTLDECFENVVWVPPDMWSHVDFRHLVGTRDLGYDSAAGPLQVGCVPFIDSIGEIDFRSFEQSGRRWYSVRPMASLADRVVPVLDALDASGCHIGLLPESAVDAALLAVWKATVVRRPRPLDPPSRLRWLIVGSGPTATGDTWPPNRLVLIDRDTGEELAFHDKKSPYTMTDADLAGFGLDSHRPGPLSEYMEEGKTLTLLSCHFGRIALEICEDLDRVEENLRALRAVRPHLLVVPVMSSYLIDHSVTRPFWKWEAQRAQQHSTKVGCATVVSTSLAFPRLAFSASGDTPPATVVTSVCFPPARVSRAVAPAEGINSWDPVAVQVHDVHSDWFTSP